MDLWTLLNNRQYQTARFQAHAWERKPVKVIARVKVASTHTQTCFAPNHAPLTPRPPLPGVPGRWGVPSFVLLNQLFVSKLLFILKLRQTPGSTWLLSSTCFVLLRLFFAFVCISSLRTVIAAEPICLRLREQPVVESQLVRVGDLIEVVTGRCQQTDDLMELPIAPAPHEGSPQTWTRADVVKHLELRGLHATAIRWMGSERTQLRHGKPVDGNAVNNAKGATDQSQPIRFSQTIPGRTQSPAFIQERAVKQAEMLLSQAITEYVTLKSGDRTDWRVKLTVPPQFVSVMQVKTNIVSIGGGKEPWQGEQSFVFEVKDRGALVSVPIKATLQLPPLIVVSKRALRLEEIITAEDLDYSPIPQRSTAAPSDFFTDIEELVGKQMRRSVATGQPIESRSVGEAVVVTRGEMVEVESIAGDIVVTTSGRASESGAVGDLIGVELLPSRKRINASVTAPMKVRVSAVSARTKR